METAYVLDGRYCGDDGTRYAAGRRGMKDFAYGHRRNRIVVADCCSADRG